MAENKRSFVLYVDLIHTVRKMPKDKQAELFMAILEYVNDENPAVDDLIVSVAFEPIRQQLKRDLRKWEQFRAKQSEYGKLGGRPPKQKPDTQEDKKGSLSEKKDERVESLNATVSVSATVSERERDSPDEIRGIVVFDVEELITKNQIQFERICTQTGKRADFAKQVLRKYHLWLKEYRKYPMTPDQLFAGFEKWLMNEKDDPKKPIEYLSGPPLKNIQ